MRRVYLSLVLLVLSSLSFSQSAGRFSSGGGSPATTIQIGPNNSSQVVAAANAAISIYTYPGATVNCATSGSCILATTYTDQTLVTPCPTSTQITLDLTNTCVANADALGNFAFWAPTGTYQYCLTFQAKSACYNIMLGASAAGSTNITACATPNSVAVYAVTGQIISCNPAMLVTPGTENSQSWPDNVSVANALPGAMKLAAVGGVPSIGFNGPLSPILTSASLGTASGPASLDTGSVIPIAQLVTSLTNCDGSHAILGNRTCGTIGSTSLQHNGISNTTQTTLNLQDAVAFHGLTFTYTNPSGGNVQPVIGGSLDLATQTHPSITINGVTCTLGSSCSPSGSSGSTLLNSQGTLTAVTGTGSPANLFTFTIPGGTMSTTSCIRATVGFQHTTGAGSPTYTFAFGGTGFTAPAIANTGTGQAQFLICNTGATNTQVVEAFKSYQISQTVQAVIFGTAAVDTTVNQSISFQFTATNADAVTPKFWMVESAH